jgi:hypothetical protein
MQDNYHDSSRETSELLALRSRVAAALRVIHRYGGIDGAHHKQWVLDQTVRALAGAAYDEWVRRHNDGDDGPMPKDDNDKSGTDLFADHPGNTAPPWRSPSPRPMPPGTIFRGEDIKMTFTPPQPDPMVKFLEEQVAKLETRLRASEAHCRRYAVACGKYRSAARTAKEVLRVMPLDVSDATLSDINKTLDSIDGDINDADALIDPVATEVVK